MERIQNMLYDLRFMNPADVESERQFLLSKARQDSASSAEYELLADLELHLAEEHNIRAEEYALEALKRQPGSSRANAALAHALDGKHVDPRNNTHNTLIAHYKACIDQHPDAVNTYAWLLAQLIDDGRLHEAHYYCDLMARYDNTYFLTVQRIKVALASNDISSAKSMWEQMVKEHPTNWSVHHWIGDFQMQVGDYNRAKASYNYAISLLNVPRYLDPVDSLAKVCEMDRDYAGALAARKLELEITEKEWGDTVGESVDSIRREILRLEALL